MNSKIKLSPTNVPKVLYENRYCNQEGFSVLVCGGKDRNNEDSNKVLEIKIPSFEVTEFPPMMKPHIRLKLATINSEIFAIVDSTSVYEELVYLSTSVEIYSEEAKSWN